jgi:hypothetical protein
MRSKKVSGIMLREGEKQPYLLEPQSCMLHSYPTSITAITSYNSAPAKADMTNIPSTPKPALLTPMGAAAPVLPGEPLSPVASGTLPLDVRLALPLGVPVALAVLFPEQRISLGFTPLSMKQTRRSETVCS